METNHKNLRRIVTSHNVDGKAVISSDVIPFQTYKLTGKRREISFRGYFKTMEF